MQRCTRCSRHVWERESRCPFCSAPLREVQCAAPVVIAALVGLSLAACNGEEPGAETTMLTTSGSMSATSAGTDSMSSTNNVPTSTSEMTGSSTAAPTSSDTATSTSSTTSTSDTSSTTSPDTSTSGSESTSTSSASSSSSTGETSGTDTGTTQQTTGGDCTGRGEQICDGVCVDTLWDGEHCGECFNACDGENGNACNQGECVFINPYGAPMPDALWV